MHILKSNNTNAQLAINGGDATIIDDISIYNSIGEEEKNAVLSFMDRKLPLSGFHGSAQPTFFGGPEVRAFEDEWAQYFGSKHVISVNSATSGLIAAMGAIGISPGDEVIVPPYTMSATAIAPIVYGGVPIFVDIEDDYFGLDIEKVRHALSPRTKAILVVNLWGHPAELTKLRQLADEKGIYLIEDNAQSILAKENDIFTGHIGHIGVYSMNVHKHIQSGEGGVCVTDDSILSERLALIRNHGENVTEWLNVEDLTNIVGFNFRQTEIGAAISRAQLKKVEEQVNRCKSISQTLTRGIQGLEGLYAPKVREDCSHNYFMWSFKFKSEEVGCSRNKFFEALSAEGMPVAQGYVPPIYKLPMFRKKIAIGNEGFPFSITNPNYEVGICPVTERLHEKEIIQYQPVSWDPTSDQIEQMIGAIHKVHSQAKTL